MSRAVFDIGLCLGIILSIHWADGGEGNSTSQTGSRPAVHPRRNVDEFAPTRARFVRFTVLKTNRGQPCLDELEVFTSGPQPTNVALASAGAKVRVSGTLQSYRIHKAEHINDGFYGNGRSWISNEEGVGWVEIELAEVQSIEKVIWGRDREGKFIDRLPTDYRIEVALVAGQWRCVASSADRRPLQAGAEFFGSNPGQRIGVNRFAPVQTTLSPGSSRSASSEYTIRVWQTEDGLPASTISAILQTDDGYLWLGTLNGLVRFDGVRFVVFGEQEGLPNPGVTCLLEDRNKSLWVGTEGGGLARRDPDGESFTIYSTANGLSHNVILSLTEDAEGNVWVGSLSGLDRLRDGEVIPESNRFGVGGRTIQQVAANGAGELWVYADTLSILKNGRIAPPPFENDEPGSFTSLHSIHRGGSGALWVGGSNGYVARIKEETIAVFGQEHGLLPDIIWSIWESRNGDLWVGTASGGLSRLRDGRFTTFTTEDGLSNNSIRSIHEDHEGNIWVGTNGGGLIRLSTKKLQTFTTQHGISHDVIMSLAEDHQKQVWIGSNCGGLNICKQGQFSSYSINYLLDNECIWPLVAGRDGNLWIGTWGGGLFQKKGDKIINYLTSDGLSDNIVLALCEDTAGGLWIGTYTGGLNYLSDGKFTHYTTRDGLSANTITSIVEESPGKVWIGTSGGGLNCLEETSITHVRRAQGLASDFVRTLYLDGAGSLWIGTSGGLSLLKNGRCFSFTTEQGLVDNVISQILEDDDGNLWLGSNQGISRVRKQDLIRVASGEAKSVNAISYGKEDGMESLECTGGFHPAGLRTSDGLLWFSTVKGIVKVNPKEIAMNPLPPRVIIEETWVNGERGAISAVATGVQRLEFRYTALSFSRPDKIKFKYKIEGLEESWIDAGSRRVAAYAHLPAGEYKFRVIASNSDGVWNHTGAAVAFKVLPRFWETWWFIGGLTLAGTGAAAGAARYVWWRNLRERLRRLEQAHALEKERTRIARDIHDDIGAGLTQISLLSDLGQKIPEPQGHLEQISVRAREIVESMDAIVWSINPSNDMLDHLADYIPRFAEDFLRTTSIRCRMAIPPILPEIPLSAEVRHNLFLTVKEALHNVVKHSGGSEVWVRLSVDGHLLSIRIEDNGQGFALDPAHGPLPGNGLVNMKKRLEEMGGELEVLSQPGQGTQIILRLQLTPFERFQCPSV